MKLRSNRLLKWEKAKSDSSPVNGNVAGGKKVHVSPGKRTRGRKRKTVGSSGCNRDDGAEKEKISEGGAEVGGMVLRSRTTTMGRNVKVVHSGPNRRISGFKRKITECVNRIELQMEEQERPYKKAKRRGRPPKEAVSKLKRRGRPPKVHPEVSQGVRKNTCKNTVLEKLKRRGRPPKMQVENLERTKRMVVKKSNDRLKGKMQEVTGDNQQNNDGGGGLKQQQQEKKLVRDRIVSMLMKAGWKLRRIQRKQSGYKDTVYIDLKGRTHWSIIKAYCTLKKAIKDRGADRKEIYAFTPLPEEELSRLCRAATKLMGDKNSKKKKKPVNKSKDGPKRKERQNSAVRLAKKSSYVKLRGAKARRVAKVSQKGGQTRKSLSACSHGKRPHQSTDGGAIYGDKCNLLSWMIDLGVVLPGGKVQYGKSRKKRLFEGTITANGIHCGCCSETMGISRFVSHAGGELRQSFANVYLESGASLQKCLLDSWRKVESSNGIRFNHIDVSGDDPNDDTCYICGDGGDLVCCDGCPSTFHQSCLDIQDFPSGQWHCIYCSCKFCGDCHEPVISEMLSCSLCEERFHRSCIREANAVKIGCSRVAFCGTKCKKIYEQLQAFLGVKFELEEGFSYMLLHRSDLSQDSKLNTPLKIECNSKLALALSVMDECFVPIVDQRTRINTINSVVYNCGSNFRRLNYAGFFTAILERDDELISAASIRIHGSKLAEMPFIATREMYRRQGMCHRLLDSIESVLCSLGVAKLVVPAIPDLFLTWTKVFGFKPLEESTKRTIKSMNMVMFPGTDMLQKHVPESQPAYRNLRHVAGRLRLK